MFYCSKNKVRAWAAVFQKIQLDVHHINETFVPYAVVELGPALAEGGVPGTRRDNLFAHDLVKLGYYINVKAFQSAPDQLTSEILANRYFLAKAQVQTWDAV